MIIFKLYLVGSMLKILFKIQKNEIMITIVTLTVKDFFFTLSLILY